MTEQEIKAAVRKRDGFLCVDCGITQGQHIEHFGRGLDVHRLSPGSEYSIDGCVALCFSCHGIRHRKLPRVAITHYCHRLADVVSVYTNKSVHDIVSEILEPSLIKKIESLNLPIPQKTPSPLPPEHGEDE